MKDVDITPKRIKKTEPLMARTIKVDVRAWDKAQGILHEEYKQSMGEYIRTIIDRFIESEES